MFVERCSSSMRLPLHRALNLNALLLLLTHPTVFHFYHHERHLKFLLIHAAAVLQLLSLPAFAGTTCRNKQSAHVKLHRDFLAVYHQQDTQSYSDKVNDMAWSQLEPTGPHLTYVFLTSFLMLYALFSLMIRNRLHLSEPPLATLFGIVSNFTFNTSNITADRCSNRSSDLAHSASSNLTTGASP
jgi:hypothetical protein